MNYLSIENLSKSYGERELFKNITFGLEKGEKVALIAKNGTGKSTLLNIIAGIEIPDSGTVTKRNDITVSYLPQSDNFDQYDSVMDAIFESKLTKIQTIKEYETALLLIEKNNSHANHERLNKAIESMDRLNAWDFENKIKEILSKFGINDILQNINHLSGGQRKKTLLAKTLIEEADVIILDEPTNHLDIDMIEWLENFLQASNTTLLMVTHDRYFLNNICSQIIELDNAQLYLYKGKYDYYIEKKSERISNEVAEQNKIKQLYFKELEWVHTSPQARTTKAKARISAFETLKESVVKTNTTNSETFKVKTDRLGTKILEINNLDFSYGNVRLLSDFSYNFKKNEKCGIVGKNGTGKSTFLKLIMRELKANRGKIVPGLTVKFGYFSQEGFNVKGNKRIIDIVKEHAEIINLDKGNSISVPQFLNMFGFTYEKQYTYYEELSGGEKRKLYLLMTLLQNPNFLILDEPTNDFDIDTLNLLEDFLTQFQGCLLIVSHDRWFMDKLVDHMFVFEGNGKIKDYYGNYTEYRIAKEKEQKRLKNLYHTDKETKKTNKKNENDYSNKNKLTYKENKELEELDIEIDKLEKEKNETTQELSNPNNNFKQIDLLSNKYKQITDLLDKKSERWLKLSEKKEQQN